MSIPLTVNELHDKWKRQDELRAAERVEARRHMTMRSYSLARGMWHTSCACGWESEGASSYQLLGFVCGAFEDMKRRRKEATEK